jgi:hypothetical protein
MKAWWIIIPVLAILIGAGGWFLGNQAAVAPEITPTSTPTQTPLGGDRDAHGCIGSAGYTWCEVKQKCLRVWEESCATPTDEAALKTQIKAAIVAKRGAVAEEAVISVNKVEGDYAVGGANPPTPGVGGGMWFAAKVGGVWQLVWDGNGMILCSDLTNYPQFPTDIIPECFNNQTGKMIER